MRTAARLFLSMLCLLFFTACAMIRPGSAPIAEAGSEQPAKSENPPAARKNAQAPSPKRSGLDDLARGLQYYDQGRFRRATDALLTAVKSGLSRQDKVKAQKHLAFIYCITDREALCREAFKRALTLDSTFTLTAAEGGHPQWGPVFRELKPKADD
jgi:hypothetical protein